MTARRSSPTRAQDGRVRRPAAARRCSRPPISPAATSRRSCWRARSSAIPKILLVGQPTRGVDIGAIEFIHKRIVAQRDAGKAVLLVSVELDEIFALSDRIIVLCGGRITGERRPEETNAQDLGLLMAGVSERAA